MGAWLVCVAWRGVEGVARGGNPVANYRQSEGAKGSVCLGSAFCQLLLQIYLLLISHASLVPNRSSLQ